MMLDIRDIRSIRSIAHAMAWLFAAQVLLSSACLMMGGSQAHAAIANAPTPMSMHASAPVHTSSMHANCNSLPHKSESMACFHCQEPDQAVSAWALADEFPAGSGLIAVQRPLAQATVIWHPSPRFATGPPLRTGKLIFTTSLRIRI